ncbi:MAG: 30S ribosomal protein S4 [Nitrospiraceae bacterium]|nr:30S ribosomal protein S4 [Nitrospiraceae bacterium]
MARYTGADCRQCRREGQKLFLKGDRCFTEKCSVERRKYPAGQHGQRRGKLSDYGVQLREKQKVKNIYGLLEKQFRNYFEKAAGKKGGSTGETLLQFLERRLDNIVFRMGFANNRTQARQFVGHGFFAVNGRKVSIPSYQVKPGEIIEVVESKKNHLYIEENLAKAEHRGRPEWLDVDADNRKGKVLHIPAREEIPLEVQEQLIVELYSK